MNWNAPATYLLIALVSAGFMWVVFSAVREWRRPRGTYRPVAGPPERPAIAIGHGASAFSRIGGLPQLPENEAWPVDEAGTPLAFLCQIALPELPDLARELGFPARGALFFFYDWDQSAWGFDPKDRLKWRVLHTPEVPSAAGSRALPAGLAAKRMYAAVSLGFSVMTTWLDPETAPAGREPPLHMMGGYPDAIQNPEMDEECELASSGINLGSPEGWHSAEAEALRQKPRDWVLLLQLDSDDVAHMMWGDGGTLYFWIRRDDLRRADFSRVWMILQCY